MNDVNIIERPKSLILLHSDGKKIVLTTESDQVTKDWTLILLSAKAYVQSENLNELKSSVPESFKDQDTLILNSEPNDETYIQSGGTEQKSLNQLAKNSSIINVQIVNETAQELNSISQITQVVKKKTTSENLNETVKKSTLALNSSESENQKVEDTNQQSSNNSNESNQQISNEETTENDQNCINNNLPPDDPNKPSFIKFPTFFDPLPPIKYEATLEIQIKKKRKKPPKIIRKLVPASNDLERRSQLFLQGDFPCEKVDFSAASAHRKIRNIKHTFDKSVDNLKFTEDTVEKAKAKNFKSILTPAAVLPVKSKAFEYQYIIEDPKTGLCLSTSEIQNFYSPEELEVLLLEIEKMEQETKFFSKISTKRIKGKFFL